MNRPASWLEQLDEERIKQTERDRDPVRRRLEPALRAVQVISSTMVCSLAGLRPNSVNMRKLTPTLRALGFVLIRSRTLPPGGHASSQCRGWARPVREPTGLREEGDWMARLAHE
jgi:hypothetical protein